MSDYKQRQRELVKWRLDNIHECENCFKKTEREERWFLECPFDPCHQIVTCEECADKLSAEWQEWVDSPNDYDFSWLNEALERKNSGAKT